MNNFKRFFAITAIFTLYAVPLCGAQKSAEKQLRKAEAAARTGQVAKAQKLLATAKRNIAKVSNKTALLARVANIESLLTTAPVPVRQLPQPQPSTPVVIVQGNGKKAILIAKARSLLELAQSKGQISAAVTNDLNKFIAELNTLGHTTEATDLESKFAALKVTFQPKPVTTKPKPHIPAEPTEVTQAKHEIEKLKQTIANLQRELAMQKAFNESAPTEIKRLQQVATGTMTVDEATQQKIRQLNNQIESLQEQLKDDYLKIRK